MHWQTHTVFNQPSPLCNSNLFLSDTALREASSAKARAGMAICWRALANSWGRPNRWSWGAWPTAIHRNCCAMTQPDRGLTMCVSIRLAFTDAGAVR
ncbi:alkylation response protein AidB [Klebsiella michiganensis]|nr:alkylation response protein AidB [Klebsiella michiganensis]